MGWFKDWVDRRLSSKRNFLMAVVGETGSGKSYLALRLAERFDRNKDFDSSHMIFTAKQFLDSVKELGNNCFIVIDEAGLMFSHREYQSMVNKMLSFVLQSFRYKFINCIFTVPSLGFMDYVGRGLMHCVVRMLDRGKGAVYRVQKDQLGRKIYFPKIGVLKTGLPSKEVVETYEKKKEGIMNERYESYRLETEEKQFSFRYASPLEIIKYISEEDMRDSLLDEDGDFDVASICAFFDVNITKAYVVRKMLNKGILEKVAEKRGD